MLLSSYVPGLESLYVHGDIIVCCQPVLYR